MSHSEHYHRLASTDSSSQIGRFLLLTDLSGASFYILYFTFHLAQLHKPHHITLLNVYSTSDLKLLLDPYDNDERKANVHSSLMENMLHDLEETQLQHATSFTLRRNQYKATHNGSLEGFAELSVPQVTLQAMCVEGDTVAQAMHHAKTHNLVVFGAQGLNYASKRIFGGVASKMISRCEGHVMLVVPIPLQKKDPFSDLVIWTDREQSMRWVRQMEHSRLETMVFCVDSRQSEADTILLNTMIALATPWKSQIICVHVDTDLKKREVQKRKVMSRMISEDGSEMSDEGIKLQFLKDEWRAFKERMEEYSGAYENVKYVLLERREKECVVDVLDEWLSRKKPDLVAMIKRKHGIFKDMFHKSVSNKLSDHLRVPFLLYHE